MTGWSYLKSLAIIRIIISPLFKLRHLAPREAAGWIIVIAGVSLPAFTRRQGCSLSPRSGLALRADPAFSWGFLLTLTQLKLPYAWRAQEPVRTLHPWLLGNNLSKKSYSCPNMPLMSDPSALKHFYHYLPWRRFLPGCLQAAIQLLYCTQAALLAWIDFWLLFFFFLAFSLFPNHWWV